MLTWFPGVNVDALPLALSREDDPRYRNMRLHRAAIGHRLFLEKGGVTEYFGFDEEPCAS
jgi:hypothetical protein